MPERRDIVLVGGGGHCAACIDVIEAHGGWRIVAILDRGERAGGDVLGYRIAGTDADIARFARQGTDFLVTVGQIGSAQARLRLFEMVRAAGGNLPAVVSPHALVSAHARLGAGTVVMHRALVNCGAVVGDNVIVNSMALIEHGARVGHHCHVATAAIVNGDVVVGDRCFIGSNAVLFHGARVPDDSIVPAAAAYRIRG